MSLLDIVLLGIGLSMDAFAVSICYGLGMKRFRRNHAAVIALYFGAFQALMPTLGWLLGSRFASAIESVDHWIAFVILGIIGANMLREARSEEETAARDGERLDHRQLLALAVATSIDALATGVTLAFLDTAILRAAALIGLTTFTISFAGVAAGNWFGGRFRKPAEIAGGVILILIGAKILLEHLGIL